MFAALLDTSVLWPSLQRDFLLSMAIEGLYRPLWSEAILEELLEHESLKLQHRGTDLPEADRAAARLVSTMRAEFADALVHGWDRLEGSFGLPDRDDEHVVAAAVIGGAGVIVTANLRDFPASKLPDDLRVLPPAEFAADTVSVDPERAAKALNEIARRYRTPRRTAPELLALLASRYEMDAVAEMIRPLLWNPSPDNVR